MGAIMDFMSGLPTSLNKLTSTRAGDSAVSLFVAGLWDAVNTYPALSLLMKEAMYAGNIPSAARNNGSLNHDQGLAIINAVISMDLISATTLATTGMGALGSAVALAGKVPGASGRSDIRTWGIALAEPNIAGIPISAPEITQEREVDVSEQMVIVQSLSMKKYWTDNAVPHPKQWRVTGYLTSLTDILDRGVTVKPSLTLQQSYLDTIAASRRPVLFKTSRGEFSTVHIMSLQFHEEASYNNAIHIECSLREFVPYEVETAVGSTIIAEMKE